jgi:uncharacterized protein YjbJ (UPF0337 family)
MRAVGTVPAALPARAGGEGPFERRLIMGTLKHRVKGALERIQGRAERSAGAMTNDAELEARGSGREAKGKLRGEAARAVQKGKAKINQAVGRVERKI